MLVRTTIQYLMKYEVKFSTENGEGERFQVM